MLHLSTVVTIPEKFTIYKINDVLCQIISPDLNPLDSKFIFDLTRIQFCDPGGIAVLYNLCMWLKESESVEMEIKIDSSTTNYKHRQAMAYIEDCGFFSYFFDVNNIFGNGELRSTTLPIRLLKVQDSYQWNRVTLKQWLQKSTGRNAEFSNIQVGIEEIFNNIQDHSSKRIGCVFGQFFPRRNEVVITASDFGLGIPNVMRTTFDLEDELELLLKALEEGVSTRSTPRNRGAGLPNIMRSLTSSNIGTVQILSNYAKVKIEDGEVTSKCRLKNYYPGTFFELTIDISNEELYESEEEEEFGWS